MYYYVFIMVVGFSVVGADLPRNQKIVGGSVTTIDRYPFAAALLLSYGSGSYYQACGGTVLTVRAVLSAAHCFYSSSPSLWRVRVGSTYANSGGTVYSTASFTLHTSFNSYTLDHDVAILRPASNIAYVPNAVAAASIAGANYNLADNQAVYAIGWGSTTMGGATSEQLRHVQIWTINQATCKSRYAELGNNVTDNMLCSGWLDVGGRDQCQGDSGGPLLHNSVVVGICSWGNQCALPRYPGVNTRVSRYTGWIQNNVSLL